MTSTFSTAIDSRGALREGVDHRVGDASEQRLQQLRQRPAREIVLERTLDSRGPLRQRRKTPGCGETPERPLHQAQVDRLSGAAAVQGSERLAQPPNTYREGGAGSGRSALLDRGGDAPGKKARVGFDVVHQRVDLAGAVLDDRRSCNALHALEFFMSIVQNRKAFHDYFIEERYEAGLALDGWEVKAIRAGRAQLAEAYVFVRGAELFLIGAHVSPLPTVSTHFIPDPTRSRKLLMHGEEIKRLIGKVEQRGYTLVPLDLHYSKGRIKLEIALARGKLKHDKRAGEREKDWSREEQRLVRSRSFLVRGRFGERQPGRHHCFRIEG